MIIEGRDFRQHGTPGEQIRPPVRRFPLHEAAVERRPDIRPGIDQPPGSIHQYLTAGAECQIIFVTYGNTPIDEPLKKIDSRLIYEWILERLGKGAVGRYVLHEYANIGIQVRADVRHRAESQVTFGRLAGRAELVVRVMLETKA